MYSAWSFFVITLATALFTLSSGCRSEPAANAEPPPPKASVAEEKSTSQASADKPSAPEWTRPPDSVIKTRLSPLQYRVTQQDGTEPPFQNAYWDNKREGLYVDVVTGEPLFSSRDKFASGTGWPSFTKPVDLERVSTRLDRTLGMTRTEARSKTGDSHLGHVFPDGPEPTGERWCINSAALRFIPKERLVAEGYGAYLPHVAGPAHAGEIAPNICTDPGDGAKPGCSSSLEVAVLAGGCFWGMEEILRQIPGVLDTEVGYAGGKTDSPSYKQVSGGGTGHAESVRVVFDPTVVSYETLLEKWFFRMHDPTTPNRQGNDRGSQYRSAIFYTSPAQKRVAEAIKLKVDKSGKWDDPVVTEIAAVGPFTAAEAFHQDYLQQNPNGYTCHYLRD